MKLLLDTHVLLWFEELDPALSRPTLDAINDPDNDVMVSLVSLWELAVKLSTGRLKLSPPALDLFDDGVERDGFGFLPVSRRHAWAVARLPFHHRDPFDRMLVAQAQLEGLTLVTHDRRLAPYGVPILWT